MPAHPRRSRSRAAPGSARGLALGGVLALAGCGRLEPASPPPFRLTHVRPASAEGLFLNEELVFYFSEEIDPASVTGASVEIRAEDGATARGRTEVEFDAVRFVPAPVLAADLSDGGFRPGTRYTVTLAGFPRPEGLRSARGAWLDRTRTWTFGTVEVAAPRASLVFEDRFQDRPGILRVLSSSPRQGAIVGTHDPIYLACDKPLDPSTVLPSAFTLVRGDDPARAPVDVRVRVLENRPEVGGGAGPPSGRSSVPPPVWTRERRACLIELRPGSPLAAGGSGPHYLLRADPFAVDEHPLLRDFSGNPVVADAPSDGWRITVDLSGDSGRSELREEFDSRRLRSAVALPGVDGTAAWSETGRVTVRYPAAAGNGEDGRVRLADREGRADVQATALELPAKTTCALSAEPGLVVLRAQGRLTIDGRLAREAPWDPEGELVRDPTAVAWNLGSRPDAGAHGEPPPTLSAWLESARAGDWNWTVLIAGGDLVVAGEIACSTPLLLVAGGTVRVSGSIRGVQRRMRSRTGVDEEPAREIDLGSVFLLRESGGGFDIAPPHLTARLVVDEPQGANPLVAPLRFAALSAPVPARGEVLRWLPAVVGGGPGPRASGPEAPWRVRYLRELASAPRRPEDLAAVDEPFLLDPPGAIQFLVELQVAPGGAWDPPWVDFLQLAWERPVDAPGGTGGR